MIKNVIHKLKNYKYQKLNYRIIIYVVILCGLGIQLINSATDGNSSYINKQIIGFVIGGVAMIVCTLIDYKWILKFFWVYYFINLILLLVVRVFGDVHKGAQRWIDIPGFSIQPSELTKILLILFFASFIQKYHNKINKISFLLILVVLLGIPSFLVLKQPDLSTTIVIVLTFVCMVFLAGISKKIIGIVLGVSIPLFIILTYLILQPNSKILEDYQLNRIIAVYKPDNPDTAKYRYQQENSVLAIGSGGLYGKGLNNNTITSVKNGNYLDEPQTDFIFTIIGEELGFVGCVFVIVIICLLCMDCFITGARAPDLQGRLVCCGLGSLIAVQSIINIAVVTMLIPNTGLTLPFISYGLNSIISMFMCIGIVLNISMQRNKSQYVYNDELNL